MVCILKDTGTGLLNHHVKKGNKMVVMIDLDQNLFPSTASFGASFCFHCHSIYVDVGVVNNDHLRGRGGQDIH